jgi:tetratricopeptide (TPR) repeat protein
MEEWLRASGFLEYLNENDLNSLKSLISEWLSMDRESGAPYLARGLITVGEDPLYALADFATAIDYSDDSLPLALAGRGFAYALVGDEDHARDEFAESVRFVRRGSIYEPMSYWVLLLKARAHWTLGKHKLARDSFQRAMRINKTEPFAYIGLGLMLATCADESIRDVDRSIALSKQACELTGWRNWQALDALAAGYAAQGTFDEAVRLERLASEHCVAEARASCLERIERYESRERRQK